MDSRSLAPQTLQERTSSPVLGHLSSISLFVSITMASSLTGSVWTPS